MATALNSNIKDCIRRFLVNEWANNWKGVCTSTYLAIFLKWSGYVFQFAYVFRTSRQKLSTVDGSCIPWTVNWRVSHAFPPHLVRVKINFDEAQKLTWKEIKYVYGSKTMITSNHISEFLKMQLESKSRNIHT